MHTDGVVYRPPNEAGSLIIRATIGCPHNACAFCSMYKEVRFRARPLATVIDDLDRALAVLGPGVRTIFLADGNSAALATDRLVAIGEAAGARFPQLERITTYGSARFLVRKSIDDWRRIAAAGITRVHSGLESGDPVTLSRIAKGVTPEQATAAFRHLRRAGLELSVYVMIGVAGTERWREHADGSAAVLSDAEPDFVRLRTYVPMPGTPWHERWQRGDLTLPTAHQALAETRRLVTGIRGPTTLLSDHISNFIDVRGRLPADRARMLAAIDEAARRPATAFRPPTESLVGLAL